MKTTFDAIDAVYDLLKGEEGLSVPVYKYRKPTNLDPDEYVVINSLPIMSGVLQKCHVNVNYYVKDLAPGVPDNSTLESGSNSVIGLIDAYGTTGLIIDFEQQQVEYDLDLLRHYSNIRFSVKLVN